MGEGSWKKFHERRSERKRGVPGRHSARLLETRRRDQRHLVREQDSDEDEN
jgi:hypothetical protein